MAGTEGTTGQSATPDSAGATGAGPQATVGQPPNQGQTTVSGTPGTTAQGTDSGQVESFFDPKSIEHSPELQAAYKQMQGKWTKEMQRVKEGKSKIEAYDSFLSNPVESMRQLAQQYGWNLVQGDPNAKPDDQTPQTWDEVYERAKKAVMDELKPVLGEVRQLKQQNVEQYLDTKYSDWRQYEDEMLGTLKEHPSLAHDPDKLYRLSVPPEVLEARAMAAAMNKLKGNGAQLSGTGTTTNQPSTSELPKVGSSFNEHVEFAKKKLAAEGIRP